LTNVGFNRVITSDFLVRYLPGGSRRARTWPGHRRRRPDPGRAEAAQLRGAAPALDFGGYLGFTAFGYGPHYRPHDNFTGTLATALVALDAGITTIVDNSHNSRTPEHSSAAVEALVDSGIRGVHASGAPVGAHLPTWPADVTRLRSEYFTSEDQLVTLRLFDVFPTAGLWEFARREGLWMSNEMGSHIDYLFAAGGQRADVLADAGTSPL
jgi:5-methylthioadenosine/S-adenosylhomocysteine deaminase